MHAFIVESPGKVPHIQKYLDALYGVRAYVVAATCGHFCGLPKMDGQAFADVVDLASWNEHWTIHKTDIHARLKRLISDAERVFIATDADREGEAIAWHLMRVFHLDDRRAVRIRYTEVTKPALKAAVENPSTLDVKLVAAQRARQVLDYEFGMELSRPLWRFGCRSAGRVQSAAVRILVDREAAIRSFKAQGFSTITAHYAGPIVATLHTSSPTPMVGELARQDAATDAEEADDAIDVDSDDPVEAALEADSARARFRVLRLTEPAIATRLEALANASRHRLADVAKATTTRRPPPPFITSTLLSTASQTLRLPAKKVTAIAQTLFEKGLITYLRTDSTALSDEAIVDIRKAISAKHAHLLPKEPQRFATKASAQGAHEAIRPTSMQQSAALDELARDERAVYDLIWTRTFTCQAKSATLQKTTMTIPVDDHAHLAFIARGTVILEHGFLALQKSAAPAALLPDIAKGERLKLDRVDVTKGATTPPLRFTEGKLTSHLEKLGIGRPATYAAVMESIVDRDYVEVSNQKTRELAPTALGITSDGLLRASFDTLTRSDFTAQIERNLDGIAEGRTSREAFLSTFDKGLRKMLAAAGPRLAAFAASHPELDRDSVVADSKPCTKCGAARELIVARLGRMARCTKCSAIEIVEAKEYAKTSCHRDTHHGPMAKLSKKTGNKLDVFFKCLTCSYTTSSESPPPPCPRCGAPTSPRKNSAGEVFFGCTRFFTDNCRGVAETPVVKPKPKQKRVKQSAK